MECITLNNGIKIPIPGMGLFRLTDPDEAAEVTKSALQIGYRHLDGAAVYKNEEGVGRGITESGIPRNEIFVTTKIWNDMQCAGSVRRALEDSLRRLNIDYVDLYLIHWPVPNFYVKTWKEMEKLYNEGLTRAIGVSNFRIQDLEALNKVSDIVPAVNQIELHPYLQQTDLLNYCTGKGIKVESWGTITAGKTEILKEPILMEIGKNYSKSPAQVILRWNVQRGVIPLVKSSDSNRQKQNLEIFDFKITETEMEKISLLGRNMRLGPNPDDFNF